MRQQSATSRARRRYVYTLTGPSGTYVGCGTDAVQRSKDHRAQALRGRYMNDAPVHLAMRADGVDTYAFAIVACANGLVAGQATERAVIERLHADGVQLLNVNCVPGRRRGAGRYGHPIIGSILADVKRRTGRTSYLTVRDMRAGVQQEAR